MEFIGGIDPMLAIVLDLQNYRLVGVTDGRARSRRGC